jgi:predicted short-subunit dehydrogenase-like oxidoreductase (DUF2520 family)
VLRFVFDFAREGFGMRRIYVARLNWASRTNMPRARTKRQAKLSVAIVGAGNLASALGAALIAAGYLITEVVVRNRAASLARGRVLATKLGAKLVQVGSPMEADVIWLCVRDDSVAAVAEAIATAGGMRGKVIFHSSGVLASDVLAPLRSAGAKVAAVHPIMTFVGQAKPSFREVWFGVEGDAPAVRVAENIIVKLGGVVLNVSMQKKVLYHAWGAFASPLLAATLALAEEVGRAAGIPAEAAHDAIVPLVKQTIANYAEHGVAGAFSGPLRRGDVATVARHLEALRAMPRVQEAYVALARSALHTLPVRGREQLRRLLGDADEPASVKELLLKSAPTFAPITPPRGRLRRRQSSRP